MVALSDQLGNGVEAWSIYILVAALFAWQAMGLLHPKCISIGTQEQWVFVMIWITLMNIHELLIFVIDHREKRIADFNVILGYRHLGNVRPIGWSGHPSLAPHQLKHVETKWNQFRFTRLLLTKVRSNTLFRKCRLSSSHLERHPGFGHAIFSGRWPKDITHAGEMFGTASCRVALIALFETSQYIQRNYNVMGNKSSLPDAFAVMFFAEGFGDWQSCCHVVVAPTRWFQISILSILSIFGGGLPHATHHATTMTSHIFHWSPAAHCSPVPLSVSSSVLPLDCGLLTVQNKPFEAFSWIVGDVGDGTTGLAGKSCRKPSWDF